LWENLREIDHLEYLGAGGRIILKLAFQEWDREQIHILSCSG
jgi:hypothetical protein